ncbi:TP901 family phage tail tape measure protein [Acetoanaerobium pronyense]|uniref:TP901 family phage tail tape measure protein n=1 Tax=Acetoanaerobium pronyense TaxID=1482736 RepID=A0ABS4KLP8_9FIRM|nr:phage tail tape measure protein [Acetoanaerobium pronyense]MBP2028691.1 TP901 family phage tail tape measure protein [Acetoanaerobium pronyense]
MSGTSVVARVGLDDRGFQEGVQKIQRSLKVVKSEFAAASSKLGDFGKSTEGLKLKADSLNKQMELQRAKVAALKKSYEESVAAKGEDSRATENLRIKLNYAISDMNKMENELSDINRQIEIQSSRFTTLGESLEGIGSKMKSVGEGFSSAGKSLSMTVTAPIVAAGTGLIKLAQDFESANNEIRIGTGATGEALKELSNDFKTVYTSVNTNIGDASKVVADLNTRTGLTGDSLKDLSVQMLRLAKITGEDLNSLIPSSTRMFQDAGVSAEDYSRALDHTFKVSQNTGIGVSRLQQLMTQFGGPLRQMGFDWETAAVMLGKFEKEGVNTELVVGSLRIALGKMAREGISEPSKALAEMIARIKEAGTAGEANALALEIFGAKAGPDMAAAIREGRLDLEELIETVKMSPETIEKAAKDTETLADKFAVLKNKMAVSLEPLGARLIEAMDRAMPALERFLEKITEIIERFANLSPAQQDMIIKMALIAAAIGPVLLVIGKFISIGGALFSTLGSISTAIGAAGGASAAFGGVLTAITGPVGIAIASFVALVSAFTALYLSNEDFRVKVNETWNEVKLLITSVIEVIKDLISGFVNFTKEIWQKYGDDLIAIISSAFSVISNVVTTALNLIRDIIKISTNLINGDWQGVWEGIKSLTSNLWNGIKSIIESVLGLIKNIITLQLNYIKDFVSGIWNALKSLTSNAWNEIKTAIEKPINSARDTVKKALDSIYSFFKNLKLPEIKIPKIKLPHFSLKGSFSLNPPSVPKLSVDWYAKGGIFNAPRIIGIGESGPEAVLPIDKIDEIIGRAMKKSGYGVSVNNNISINASIRDDQDIDKLAQRIFKEQNKYRRGIGFRR